MTGVINVKLGKQRLTFTLYEPPVSPLRTTASITAQMPLIPALKKLSEKVFFREFELAVMERPTKSRYWGI